MPYGHNKQYRELVLEAQRKRLQITRQQQQQIARLYRDIAKDMGREIAKKSERTLTYRWMKDYAKALKSQSKILYSDIQGIVSLGILNTAEAFVDAEQEFWSGLVPGLSERFRDTFSSIPQTCVDELMNGGIYKDFTGLSERIWAYQKKYDRDIGYMIERGIVAQKSAYELAKDLEMYVNPKAKKPWEWQKVYPNCNRVVDYNAQRLARTSVTHAYQLSFQRATKDNPFVEQYQWNSSNAGKTCELCAKRDGKLFDKDKLPLDHPNGMCVVTAVIPKELDEIAEELNDWANGESNPALDKWLKTKVDSMSAGGNNIEWSTKGSKISPEEYKAISKYARDSGIVLEGFKRFDGDVKTIKDMVDDLSIIAKRFPEIKSGRKRITISLDEHMNSRDFAITKGHIIYINAHTFRDVSILEREYNKLQSDGWFVKGTNYHSIIRHEAGHVVENIYGFDSLEIAKKITGLKSTPELMVFLETNLSSYAGAFEDGSEIISECFSAVYGNIQNDFALRFIEECDKLKEKEMCSDDDC